MNKMEINPPVSKNPQTSELRPQISKFFELVPKTNFDFIRWRHFSYGLSLLLVVGTLVLFGARGLPLGIDFTGGVLVEFSVSPNLSIDTVRAALAAENLDTSVQSLNDPGHFLARFKKEEEEKGLDNRLHSALAKASEGDAYQVLKKEFVGAVVGEKLKDQALMAIAFSFLGIIIYVGIRFRNLIWGVAGVIALVHDVIASAGFVALMGYEIDLTVVAALLTIAGYSINDTVVIFDRLRERFHLYPREVLSEAINHAVNDTMSRTIITSGTVFFTVLALVIFGGGNLRSFSVCLLFGTLVGVYSTVGVASNLVHSWQKLTGLKVR